MNWIINDAETKKEALYKLSEWLKEDNYHILYITDTGVYSRVGNATLAFTVKLISETI